MNRLFSVTASVPRPWWSWLGYTLLFALSAWLIVPPLIATPVKGRPGPARPASTAPQTQAQMETQAETRTGVTSRPIEQIRVGERVLAENPEVDSLERLNRPVPDWSDWVHLTLEMPLSPDRGDDTDAGAATPRSRNEGSDGNDSLRIELLRPDSWVREHLALLVSGKSSVIASPARAPALTSASDRTSQSDANTVVPLSPLRPVYRDVAMSLGWLELAGYEAVGLTVELELAELGAVGTAVVTGLEPSLRIAEGRGQVVTGTFAHPPSQSVLDVWFAGEPAPLGVTANHLFWSVDRQQFLAIGELRHGERVRTYHGETKRVEQKLPRPGPSTVHNLEVFGEHVYHVGHQGLLAHNAYGKAGREVPNATTAQRAFGTPYRQLGNVTYQRLLKKVDSRTITRNEWKRLQWFDRLTERRQAGIDAFWSRERQLLTQGLRGTRNWNLRARNSILSGGKPKGIYSHHLYSVSKYPQVANDPANIVPVTFYEHFYKHHGGSWSNPTHGNPLRPDLPDNF